MKGRYPPMIILLLVLGVVITLMATYVAPAGNVAGFVGVFGAAIFVAGACLLAKENGFHPAWGMLGVFVLMGWWGVFLGLLLVGLPLLMSAPVPGEVATPLELPSEDETIDNDSATPIDPSAPINDDPINRDQNNL